MTPSLSGIAMNANQWARIRLGGLALLLTLSLLLSGCSTSITPAASTPTPAGSREGLPTPLPLATPAASTASTALSGSASPAAATPEARETTVVPRAPTGAPPTEPTPSGGAGWDLIYVQDGTVYRADYWGNNGQATGNAGLASGLALWHQYLAYDQMSALRIADLQRGSAREVPSLSADPTSSLQFLWASDGRALIYALSREDAQASTFGRSVDVGRLDVSSGQIKPLLTVQDYPGVALLAFDGPAEEFILVPRGGDPSFGEAWLCDALTGSRKAILQIEGDGTALASPDGRRLLTTSYDSQREASQIRIYEFADGSVSSPSTFTYAPNTHGAGYIWSPDGTRVAFLLRDGKSYWDNVTRGLGVWVLDTATLEAHRIADEAELGSGPVGWTPDGEWIVCFHADPGADSYYYALRPTGTERHIMTMGPQARLVGWIPSAPSSLPPTTEVTSPPVALAQIEELFRRARSDPSALAEGAAAFLLARAGWESSTAGQAVSVRRLSSDLAVVKLPPDGIYLFWPGGWQRVVVGDVMQDARLADDEVGIVFARVGASSVSPAFVLLRRQAAGGWGMVWSPAGQSEWICTDGSISFGDPGLSRLLLVGSSFGLDSGDNVVFSECHACPHRTLRSVWERQGNEYVRLSSLPPDAPRAKRLWEMTEPSPYASLYEFIRRLRAGDQVGARLLAVNDDVLVQATAHGLAEPGVRLVVDKAEGNQITFSAGDTPGPLAAEMEEQGGQWRVSRIAEAGQPQASAS